MMFASQTPILSLPVPIVNVRAAGRPSAAVEAELELELDPDLDAGAAAIPTIGEATTDTSAATTDARMRDQLAR
jgi:hypothetical protein